MSRYLLTTLLATALIGSAAAQPAVGVFPPLRKLSPPIPATDGPTPPSPGAVGRLGGGDFRYRGNGLSRGAVALSADGRTLAYTVDPSPDERLIVRRLPDGADVRESEVQLQQTGPLSVGLSPDGSAFATTYIHRETIITTLKTACASSSGSRTHL